MKYALGSAPRSSNARAMATALSSAAASGSRVKQRYRSGSQPFGPMVFLIRSPLPPTSARSAPVAELFSVAAAQGFEPALGLLLEVVEGGRGRELTAHGNLPSVSCLASAEFRPEEGSTVVVGTGWVGVLSLAADRRRPRAR